MEALMKSKGWLSLSTAAASSGEGGEAADKRREAERSARGGGAREGLAAMRRGGLGEGWLSLATPAVAPGDDEGKAGKGEDRDRSARGSLKRERSWATSEEGFLPFKKRASSMRAEAEDLANSVPAGQRAPPAVAPPVVAPPAVAPPGPTPLLRKRVTRSDVSRAQHRLQLTQADVRNSAPPLQELARLARGSAAIPVKVLDGSGCTHDLSLKFLASSSRTYRFIGPAYTAFLTASGLRAGQTLRIWALPRGINGEHRLAFLNSDV